MIENADTKLRWLITNEWSDPEAQPKALKLIDSIVGYPAPGDEAPLPQDLVGRPSPLVKSFDGVKVALVVGHNSRSPGAWLGAPLKESEYVFNNAVANVIIEKGIPGVSIKRFNRVFTGSYSTEIKRVYAEVNDFAPDIVVEMHFNGGGGNYTVMLSAKGSEKSRRLATAFQAAFVNELGFGDSGVFERSRSQRGGASLFAARAPMVLTEPFFGDSANHSRVIGALGYEGVADIYRTAIVDGLQALGH